MMPPRAGETIRLKKKYLAIIVVVMIVGVALLASLVYSSVQGSRIAYIAVRTDKDVYTSDENVTFRLVPLTDGIEFTMGGQNDPRYGMHVVRIPDDVDPAEILTDPLLLDRIYSWERKSIILPIETFNSADGPLEMSWNGTIQIYNDELVDDPEVGWSQKQYQWVSATSGHYLLYPRLQWYAGHVTKCMLDESSIFYYESLNVNISAVHSPGSFSMSMDITIGEGMPEGEYELRSRLSPLIYDGTKQVSTYLNKSMSLVAGISTHLELGPMKTQDHVMAEFDAVVEGPDGRLFAFGFSKSPNGAWYNDYRY